MRRRCDGLSFARWRGDANGRDTGRGYLVKGGRGVRPNDAGLPAYAGSSEAKCP